MSRGTLLAIASLLLLAGSLSAQEVLPMPAPNPRLAPAPPNALDAQNLAPPVGPPQPYVSAQGPSAPPGPPWPTSPYAPPPPPYAPLPYPPPLALRDPGGNPDFWVGIEGLVWWSKNQPLAIPVVTTGPASQGSSAGNLGMPGTTSLNGRLNYGAEAGFRMFTGGWFDDAHKIGANVSFFFLDQQSAGFAVADRAGDGSFVLNEPLSGAPFPTQVSAPGVATGDVAVHSSTRFGGADANLQYNLFRANGWTVNLMGGYRYLQLDESLVITTNSSLFAGTNYTDDAGNVLVAAPPGSVVTAIDEFRTHNVFNGGQIGTEVQYLWGRWRLGGTGKLAVGNMHQTITIDGNTLVSPVGGAPVPLAGGNYATLQTGRYSRDRFALVPEGQLTVGYAITPRITGTVGYNFLYLSNVARPGNQIDNSFDGVARPAVPMASSSYWSQGLTASLQFAF